MQNLKYLLILLLIITPISALASEKLTSLSQTETRSMKITVKRITDQAATVSKIVNGLKSIVQAGMQDQDFQFPEENVRRVRNSIAIIKQDIKNLQALMQGRTFDTWENDQKSIEKISRKLSKLRSRLKYIRKIHNLSHDIEQ